MAKGKGGTANQDAGESLLSELAKLRGEETGLQVEQLEPTLLWYAVVALAKRGASIQLGLTKDKANWACQLWEGQFPIKDYFASTEALNHHLAALVRLGWKRELPSEVDDIVRLWGY